MFNGYFTNNLKEIIFPKTQAKNVFTESGISVDEMFNILDSKIGKCEFRKTYYEVSEITNATTPSTFDILNAMAENTIAILNIENDSYLVSEIGSRVGGVMILVKKSSVYFSTGIFNTYRYGEVFFGTSGLGGESFNWNISTYRTIHSYHSGEATTLKSTNVYERITGWGGNSVNARLSQVDGVITIPEGVNNIMVSAYVVMECETAGDKYLQIFKNDVESKIMVKQSVKDDNEDVTLTITPLLLPVVPGETIDLRCYSNSLDTLRSKHFTVEIIN